MRNWIKGRFRDTDHARETLLISGFIIGAVGALTTLIALATVHWGADLR
jgi:hypothetical protein